MSGRLASSSVNTDRGLVADFFEKPNYRFCTKESLHYQRKSLHFVFDIRWRRYYYYFFMWMRKQLKVLLGK